MPCKRSGGVGAERGRADCFARIGDTAFWPRADRSAAGEPAWQTAGDARAANFASGEQVHDVAHGYAIPAQLMLNQWGFSGNWTIAAQPATANQAGAKLIYRSRARDLHLVMGPSANSGTHPVRIRARVDGQAPGANHGADINAAGEGVVNAERLYQLLRLSSVGEHTFEIEFLDPGAQVFTFTFG